MRENLNNSFLAVNNEKIHLLNDMFYMNNAQ